MLQLSSPAFGPNQKIPSKYTCDGLGANPPLQVAGVPPSTMSLALVVYDPDVPKYLKTEGRFLHWALWNVPPTASAIEEGHGGGVNEGGPGYVPPCPPSGQHRYVFQLFALDKTLGDAKITKEDDLRQVMQGHIIEQTELVGRYGSWTSGLVFPAIAVVAIAGVLYTLVRNHRRA